ncbi:hypothetical protein QTJ16_005765 [Diplocarpon rosae]|uniref:Histone acetyltransferase type B catalytic subunit n=1 Tax=Diplocarpon rosae TaxID=946125 RepID=A0AAD9WAQ1_9HELO|nr:hypothetical protein QTJ16_005765 [Diplocarpon rosae]
MTVSTIFSINPIRTGSAESNDALQISLVAPDVGAAKTIHSFNPNMSYSIFGDEERIFGYKGLKIHLRYNASDMRPNMLVSYDKKFKAVGETEATDLKELLGPSVFDQVIRDPISKDWKPPGELWKSLQVGNKTIEIWKGNLADMAVKQMVKRIQILVPLFIEGGSLIELDDPDWTLERWTVFFLYQKSAIAKDHNPYMFMGYSTVYRYFLYQPSQAKLADFSLPIDSISFSSMPCRSRISQFIVLPPFQGAGYGSRFYNSIFDFYLAEPETIEITVEDPNYAFDDMRDLNDLARLRALPEFQSIKTNTTVILKSEGVVPRNIVDEAALTRVRRSVKIAPRQFLRVVEMHLLSHIPVSERNPVLGPETSSSVSGNVPNLREYELWALWVKKRLWKHNRELLMQMEKPDRLEKLDEVLSGVVSDYARLLDAYEAREQKALAVGSKKNAKRASPGEGEPEAKKLKP